MPGQYIRKSSLCWVLAALTALGHGGCASQPILGTSDADLEHYLAQATMVLEEPNVEAPDSPAALASADPNAVPEGEATEYWDMPLPEVIRVALMNSKVLRDLGAAFIQAPDNAATIYNPAIVETDAQFGIEGALSEFDAIFSASILAEKNDRRFNNRVFGLRGVLDQELAVFEADITKRAATGSELAIRHSFAYDDNNSPTNEFNSSWDTILEGEVRQPLMQGAGVIFNRLAGPNSRPGDINGVLIARVRSDISLADFEIGVRDFVSNVENAYWDLYFSYRNLESRILARDAAQKTWNYVNALYEADRIDAADEAQAREQYFRFQNEVEDAYRGRPLESTRTNNGSSGGTFRPISGVRTAERRLRFLMGLPISDQRLIRPSQEPNMAEVAFDWGAVSTEALMGRPELRRQRWRIESREMELTANQNFLLPALDVVGRYRWRGFGTNLLPNGNPEIQQRDNGGPRRSPFESAYGNLVGGDFQEWQVGVELSLPIGYRQAFAAVRNSELQVAREKKLLQEQELRAIHDLSNAIAEAGRARRTYGISYNRLIASQQQMAALQASEEADRTQLDVVLDAQRRFADALSRFYETQVAYAVAMKNVQFEKGTLLEYHGVHLAEGPWPLKAYQDAAVREAWRGRPIENYRGYEPPAAVGEPPLEAVGPPLGPPIAGDVDPLKTGIAAGNAREILATDSEEIDAFSDFDSDKFWKFLDQPNTTGVNASDAELVPWEVEESRARTAARIGRARQQQNPQNLDPRPKWQQLNPGTGTGRPVRSPQTPQRGPALAPSGADRASATRVDGGSLNPPAKLAVPSVDALNLDPLSLDDWPRKP